jgi:hypothetical protein
VGASGAAVSGSARESGDTLYPELSFVGEAAGGVGSIPNPFENRTRSSRSSMFRSNSLKENNSEEAYSKSKRVSANIMSQLLLDWLETRQNAVFEMAHVDALLVVWKKYYPNFGGESVNHCFRCPSRG